MAVSNLLNKEEVIRKSQVPTHLLSRCVIGDIGLVMLEERVHCLGAEFYDALQADLHDYSAALKYTSGSYTAGDVVIYSGLFYRALVNTSAEPNDPSAWELAPKFQTDAHNDLWDGVLGRYLALSVLRDSTPPLATQIRDTGTIKVKGTREQPAAREDFEDLQSYLLSLVYRAYAMLDRYIAEHSTEGALSSFSGLQAKCSCGCTYERIDAMEALFYSQEQWDYAASLTSCNRCSRSKLRNTSQYGVY